MIEAMVAAVILAVFLIAAFAVVNATTKNVKNDLRQSSAISSSRNIASIVQSIAMYNPDALSSMPLNSTFTVDVGSGAAPASGSSTTALGASNTVAASNVVTLTLTSITQDPNATVNSAIYTFSYQTADGSTGTVNIPVHRTGTLTTGCDPANNITTNCTNYVVSQ